MFAQHVRRTSSSVRRVNACIRMTDVTTTVTAETAVMNTTAVSLNVISVLRLFGVCYKFVNNIFQCLASAL